MTEITMEWRVPLVDLDYGEEEEAAVLNVLRNRWLTMGAITQAFEDAFSEMLGVKYAIAVSNATQALHLACISIGIGPGDEVIVPALTFVATANAVLYTGADVRFADILGPDELTISPREISRQVNEKTKAILVMHYGGYPCHMQEILEIAQRYNLAVIEDAAHAPGASLNGKFLGNWGDIGCFSFFSNKNLSTGEGGMLVTNREDIAEKVRLLRSHGMTSLTWDRHQGHSFSYDVVELGYNYRIDEIRSALGMVQLNKLAANNARREKITKSYRAGLQHTSLVLPFHNVIGKPAYHLFPVLLPYGMDRSKFIECMRSERVQTSIHYLPVHLFRYYQSRYSGVSLPRTEEAAKREVTLPLYPGMDDQKIEEVISAVRNALQVLI
jgi:dTDP-4-amino-4,6-dideoxygalactose transaminase